MRAICCGVTAEPNCNISSSGENRVSPIGGMPEPGGSGMTGRSMSRVPGGAPLPPCLPLARLPAVTLHCHAVSGARTSPHPTAGPVAAAADRRPRAGPNGIWKVKPRRWA